MQLLCIVQKGEPGEFCAEFRLLDNLVPEDRHEIGCESLESHFHKAQGLVAQTRG